MLRLIALLALSLTAACGRPLTAPEQSFSAALFGASFDPALVRVVRDAPLGTITVDLPPRPRLTCQERIVPERTGTVTLSPAALVAFNSVFLSENWSLDDFVPGYPDRVSLYEAMLFAHEMTHVWQWQNRATTNYHPLKAAAEHVRLDDPYLFDPEETQPFLSYGYEQQAGLVEEYVCCALLDPAGARTARLKTLISQAIPVGSLTQPRVSISWPDAPRSGLCS